jgi:hypothetical protein
MKTRLSKTALGSACIMAACLSGCSVKTASVANEPPKFNENLTTFSSQFGTVQPESISVFFWPEGLSGTALEKAVRDVNLASQELDVLQIDSVEKAKLESEFASSQCVSKWADLGPDEDPDFVEWVRKWKKSDDVTEQAAIKSCEANQSARKALLAEMDRITNPKSDGKDGVTKEHPAAIIYKTIDPGYPEKKENMKSVDAGGSRLIIRPAVDGVSRVNVTLKDFLRPGNTQSTEDLGPGKIQNARYFPATHLLVFTVPELGADQVPTGAEFEFTLERGPDIAGLARFKGDLKLVKGDQVLRHGSAKIDGKLIAAP